MQTPIITRQKMAMNESVAATCCFRQVVSSTNYYNEVLAGGALESGPLSTFSWKTKIPQEWAWLPFDVDFSQYTGNTPVPYYNNLMGAWWVLYFQGSKIVYASSIDELLGDPEIPIAVTNEGCTHQDRNCLYIDYSDDVRTIHKGATEPHISGGQDFLAPHEAMQFSS